MTSESEPKRYVVNQRDLPKGFPTNKHAAEFWEALGRTVATFGFLEETLGKAIFAFTGTRQVPEEDAQAEFEKWLPTLEKALSDPLGGLINSYGNAVRSNPKATISNFDQLLEDLRKASAIRNVLCHGSWRTPNQNEKSAPLYVNKKGEVFDGAIDVEYLHQVQKHTVGLICGVINSVTHMGFQFPGSTGPGIPLLNKP
jgi:hypothetical protein